MTRLDPDPMAIADDARDRLIKDLRDMISVMAWIAERAGEKNLLPEDKALIARAKEMAR